MPRSVGALAHGHQGQQPHSAEVATTLPEGSVRPTAGDCHLRPQGRQLKSDGIEGRRGIQK
jgi:hypothetical protein